jgi:hypothetical protein
MAESSSGIAIAMYKCDNCDYSSKFSGYGGSNPIEGTIISVGYSGNSGCCGGPPFCHWGHPQTKDECNGCSYSYYATKIGPNAGMSGYGWSDPCDPIPGQERMGISGYSGKEYDSPYSGESKEAGLVFTEDKCIFCGKKVVIRTDSSTGKRDIICDCGYVENENGRGFSGYQKKEEVSING